MSNWISTKDRQPDADGIYLARLSDRRYMIMGFSRDLKTLERYNFSAPNGGWYMMETTYGIFEVRNVTHWMYLPDQPEEEDNG